MRQFVGQLATFATSTSTSTVRCPEQGIHPVLLYPAPAGFALSGHVPILFTCRIKGIPFRLVFTRCVSFVSFYCDLIPFSVCHTFISPYTLRYISLPQINAYLFLLSHYYPYPAPFVFFRRIP